MRRALGVAACFLAAVAVVSGAAVAADNPGLADFEPRETDAAPGEAFEIELTMQVVSTIDDEAVESIAYTLAYDPDVLSVTDVEQGPWLGGGEETEMSFETELDDEAGQLHIEEARTPPAGGVIGDGTTATVAFEVDSDASTSNTTVRYDSYEAQMLEYPLPVLHQRTEATINITEEPTEQETPPDDQPGFGPGVAAVALLVVAVIARRNQSA